MCGNTIDAGIQVISQREGAKQQFDLNKRRFRQSESLILRTTTRNQNQNRVTQSQNERRFAQELDRVNRNAQLFQGTQRVQAASAGAAGGSVEEVNRQFLLEEAEVENALTQQLEDQNDQFDFDAGNIALGAESSVLNSLPDPVRFPTFLGSYLQIATAVAKDASSAVAQSN